MISYIKNLSTVEKYGWLGSLFLMFAISQTDIFILRMFNVIATLFFLKQSWLMKSKSLLFTNIVLICINVWRMI